MWTADDRRSGRAAETAASRCLDRRFFFFPPFRLLLRRAPTRSERGATGNHYSVLQGPGPFNTHPPSSICSNRHMDLWFLFQRVSGKQMRCCWYARSGTALTGSLLLFFFFFLLHIIRPRLRSLIAAPTPEQYIITPTAEGMSSLYHSSSPVRCVFGDFNIRGFRDFSSPTSLHFSASSPRAPPDWNNVCCFWLRQEVSSMLMTSPTALVTRRWHTGHFSHLCALGKRWQEWILWWIAPLRSVASGLEKIKSSKC